MNTVDIQSLLDSRIDKALSGTARQPRPLVGIVGSARRVGERSIGVTWCPTYRDAGLCSAIDHASPGRRYGRNPSLHRASSDSRSPPLVDQAVVVGAGAIGKRHASDAQVYRCRAHAEPHIEPQARRIRPSAGRTSAPVPRCPGGPVSRAAGGRRGDAVPSPTSVSAPSKPRSRSVSAAPQARERGANDGDPAHRQGPVILEW